jgi:hypothetical protein
VADLVTTYTLTTPGPDITFNSGTLGDGTDKYWLQGIDGLDGPLVRAPVDDKPFGDGSLIHTFFKAGRRPIFDGVLIIETVPFGGACQGALNVLEDNLRQALESIIAADGTLAWTPIGYAARSLTVRHPGEPPLNIRPVDNFALRQFDFSLVSAAASW